MGADESFEVRDLRQKEYFVIDDRYLNGFAPICGVYATAVYVVLCRHANYDTQSCFPSTHTISRKLGISPRQTLRALRVLENHRIIATEKRTGKHNIYFLLDKKHWVTSDCQSPVTNSHRGSASQSQVPVTGSHAKVINKKEKKEGAFPSDAPAYRLSSFLLSLIKDRHPKFKEPDIQSWAKHVDAMLRIDKREEKEIAAVIEWCQADPFWQSNILSTDKLRKQYDRLFMAMKSEDAKNGR